MSATTIYAFEIQSDKTIEFALEIVSQLVDKIENCGNDRLTLDFYVPENLVELFESAHVTDANKTLYYYNEAGHKVECVPQKKTHKMKSPKESILEG